MIMQQISTLIELKFLFKAEYNLSPGCNKQVLSEAAASLKKFKDCLYLLSDFYQTVVAFKNGTARIKAS